jgi:2-dehydro-3-deoxy-D-arabinonate dehydratase
MHLAKYQDASGTVRIGVVEQGFVRPLVQTGHHAPLSAVLESPDPLDTAQSLLDPHATATPLFQTTLLAPIDAHEVWAAGVTYKRSMSARMEESETAASLYDKVYLSARPELFFKATPHRVVGTGGALRIRADATWNVPEPELALVLNSRLQLVGYTVGNDMSSRDIEGENPLYLPQAKMYDACCGLGPWITLAPAIEDVANLGIRLKVRRGGNIAFSGETNIAQMARSFDELIGWLGRDNSFPRGVVLLTGTGIVPDSDFTLAPGDEVEITIDNIGTLRNRIVQRQPTNLPV